MANRVAGELKKVLTDGKLPVNSLKTARKLPVNSVQTGSKPTVEKPVSLRKPNVINGADQKSVDEKLLYARALESRSKNIEREVPACAAATAAPQAEIEIVENPVDENPRARLFRVGKTVLASFGVAEKRLGPLIGRWLKAKDDPVGLLAAIEFARDKNVAEPVAYISAIINNGKRTNGQGSHAETIHERFDRLLAGAREIERNQRAGRADDAE